MHQNTARVVGIPMVDVTSLPSENAALYRDHVQAAFLRLHSDGAYAAIERVKLEVVGTVVVATFYEPSVRGLIENGTAEARNPEELGERVYAWLGGRNPPKS